MSNLEIIARLCRLLDEAQDIIRKQAELMAMHGIDADDDSELARHRGQLLEDIEHSV